MTNQLLKYLSGFWLQMFSEEKITFLRDSHF